MEIMLQVEVLKDEIIRYPITLHYSTVIRCTLPLFTVIIWWF